MLQSFSEKFVQNFITDDRWRYLTNGLYVTLKVTFFAVLMGIVSTAATSVIRKSRMRENEALRTALQAGIATYCQQEGYWPPGKNGVLQDWADNGLDAKYRSKGQHVVALDDDAYDALMSHMAARCLDVRKSRVMDFSNFVGVKKDAAKHKDSGDGLPTCFGRKAKNWLATFRQGSSMRPDDLTFGYSSSTARGKGRFRRFVIRYNSEADNVTVDFSTTKDGEVEK